MPYFSYKARNSSGQLVEGTLEASNNEAMADQLLQMDLIPVDIQISTGSSKTSSKQLAVSNPFSHKIRHLDVTMFTRQMYSLLKAGIPIMNALGGLQASTENKHMAEVIGKIYQSLDSGRDLSMALREHPQVFTPFYMSMIRIGESTGRLETIFIRLYEHLEFEKFMRDQVKSALRYPTFVICGMGIALIIVNIFVIPAFSGVFAGLKAELPLMTRILIGFSNFTVNNWYLLLAGAIGAFFGFRSWVATTQGSYQWDKIKLKIPIAGKIIQKATLARFARSFALASSSGVPIVQAMTLISDTVDNDFIADKINLMSMGIERGESVYRTAAASGIFTSIVLQMIGVGEESGSLDELMGEVGDTYQREVEYELKSLGAQIEPILITAIGILVLILALGIFLPMWDLGRAAIPK